MNINSLLITILTGVVSLFTGLVGFLGKEVYKETRMTHDAVLMLRQEMVKHAEYDVQMADVKARLSGVESGQSSIWVEIEKMKRAPTHN
jgi:hypothetical protein